MIHDLQIGLILYLGGLAVTAGLMLAGIARGGEPPAWLTGYDGRFMVFWLMLWPVSLPIVLYLLFWPRGPETGDRP